MRLSPSDLTAHYITYVTLTNVEKQILIFPAFPKTMVLNHNIDSSGNMDVTCMVENVYPEPTIHLLWNERCVPFILSGCVKNSDIFFSQALKPRLSTNKQNTLLNDYTT